MVDLDLYKNLFEQHWLEKCRHKRKLKLISVQLVKNFTKEECTRKLEEYSKKSKNKCVKENISIILNNLELIKK
jgi:hypothetical protein